MSIAVFETYWIGPFNEDWACDLFPKASERTDFLLGLASQDDTSRACDALRALFKGCTPTQVTHALFRHKDGRSVLDSWLNEGALQDGKWHFAGAHLLRAACDLGLDLNVYSWVNLLSSNEAIKTTKIGALMALSGNVAEFRLSLSMHVVGALLDHGAALDDATLHGLLVLDNPSRVQRWFEFLSKRTDLPAGRLASLAHLDPVDAGAIAYFSSIVAREAINDASIQSPSLRRICE